MRQGKLDFISPGMDTSLPWGHELVKAIPLPSTLTAGGVCGPSRESNTFSLQLAHPHPFEGWNFIKADSFGFGQSLREERGTWRERENEPEEKELCPRRR